MCDKMAISTYNMKIAENDPFLRLQMRAIEMLYKCLKFMAFRRLFCIEHSHFYIPEQTLILDIYQVVTL